MTHHHINITDGINPKDLLGGQAPQPKNEYEVIAPMFKHSRTYQPGETITLDTKTATSFIEAGNIKEKQ
jgi:hypothetical protein